MQPITFAREHEAADERVKDTFADIKASLRAPQVSSLFEAWAVYPRFLESVWRRLRPNVLSPYFQEHAHRLGETAERGISLWPVGNHAGILHARNVGGTDVRRMRDAVDFFFSVDPKLLIVARAVQLALAGEDVGGTGSAGSHAAPDEKPRDFRGLTMPMIDEQGAPLRVRRMYDEMKTTMGVSFLSKDYRVMGAHPDWLEVWWKDVKSAMQHARYQTLCDDLSTQTLESVRLLPYRIVLTSELMNQCEMGDDQRRAVAQATKTFCDALPGVCVNIALARRGLSTP